MIKIIMDSGIIYEVENCSFEDIRSECYTADTLPNRFGNGASITKFNAKFLKISDSVIIRTDHISSIEAEYNENI